MATIWRAPLILRGEVIDTGAVEYGGRRGEVTFRASAVDAHLDRLTLRNPAAMGDLPQLNFHYIVAYLQRLGNRLDPARNVHLHERSEAHTPELPSPIRLSSAFLCVITKNIGIAQV